MRESGANIIAPYILSVSRATDIPAFYSEWFFNLKYEECSISFVTDTKWRPYYDIWDFINGKYKSLSIYYQAEEPNENIFITNDKSHTFFPLKFVVDTRITDEVTNEYCYEREYFETQEKVQ